MMADKKKIIAELKTAAKTSEKIILATDPDREGKRLPGIFRNCLKSKKQGVKRKTFQRIAFHEITKEASSGFKEPRSIDENLVDAQTARKSSR